MPAAILQDVHEPEDVAVHVGPGIFQRIAHPGLGGQMHHQLRFFICEYFGYFSPILQVGLVKHQVGHLQFGLCLKAQLIRVSFRKPELAQAGVF